ncbi:MAG: PAS domain-containing protein [Christensenella sp.]|nr:PAS domain-containing protein [Christensenella sp.]
MNSIAFEHIKKVLDQAPCGMGLFRMQQAVSAFYLNDKYFELIGYTREEYEKISGDPFALILPEDRYVKEQNQEKIQTDGKLTDSEYRIQSKQGQIVWIKLNASVIELAGEPVVFTSFVDVSREHQEQEEISYREERYRLVVEQTGATVFEWNLKTGGFYCSASYYNYEMSKISTDDILNNRGSLDVVHPDDIPVLLQFFADTKSGQEKAEAVLRIKMKDDTYRWSRMIGIFKANRIIGTILDIQEEREKSDTLTGLLNAVPGGVGMYRMDDKITPIYFNDRVATLCGMTRAEYEDAIQTGACNVIHPNDLPGLLEEAHRGLAQKRPITYTYRVQQKQGGYRWSRLSGDWLGEKDGFPTICAVFTDVTDQMTTQQALRDSELKYQLAIEAAGINIWEYDIVNDVMHVISSSSRVELTQHEVKDYHRTLLGSGQIREDSRREVQRIFERLHAGEEKVSADVWFKLGDGLGYWCEHVVYTTTFDEYGKPIRAFGVGKDVTREKEAEQQYRHELAYREVMQTATMTSMNINLTQNRLVDFNSKFGEITDILAKASSGQKALDSMVPRIQNKEMLKKYKDVFGIKQLLNAFASGTTSVSQEVVRIIGGKAYWTVLNAYMMKNPESGDVMAFLYSTDSTNEKVMASVMDAVVRTAYDYLVVVDGIRDSAMRYSENKIGNSYAEQSDHFESETRNYIRQYICPDDVDAVLERFTLRNILTQLDTNGFYSLYYSVPAPNGEIQRKQLRFTYMDPQYKVFLMTRTDMTAVYEEKEKQNEELAAALRMAKQASVTKSEFLSRMSHEIRTPMNAIIGMAEIASANVNDGDFVMDCIRKSQEASRYLLSLINDVLDMSRIESGKILLSKEVFLTTELFDTVNTMAKGQADLQGVTYLFERDSSILPAYVGDETRIKQILVNLLNNAVKFTNTGGVVKLSAWQTQSKHGKAMLHCAVSDTGIGISSEFLPKLFTPFTQENDQTTARFGGSGLGLSIARNLARLMGGDITVESELGEGTSFSVSMELELTEQMEQPLKSPDKNDQHYYDFHGKRVLLCEDHPLNTMVAKKLLENRGFSVVHAENGKIGTELFEQSLPGSFDAVLMDIRMPIMDGLTASKTIRALNRDDAKVVPIIAMTANAFGDDMEKSRQAGMNAHLTKPIEPGKLYQTLQELIAVQK